MRATESVARINDALAVVIRRRRSLSGGFVDHFLRLRNRFSHHHGRYSVVQHAMEQAVIALDCPRLLSWLSSEEKMQTRLC